MLRNVKIQRFSLGTIREWRRVSSNCFLRHVPTCSNFYFTFLILVLAALFIVSSVIPLFQYLMMSGVARQNKFGQNGDDASTPCRIRSAFSGRIITLLTYDTWDQTISFADPKRLLFIWGEMRVQEISKWSCKLTSTVTPPRSRMLWWQHWRTRYAPSRLMDLYSRYSFLTFPTFRPTYSDCFTLSWYFVCYCVCLWLDPLSNTRL